MAFCVTAVTLYTPADASSFEYVEVVTASSVLTSVPFKNQVTSAVSFMLTLKSWLSPTVEVRSLAGEWSEMLGIAIAPPASSINTKYIAKPKRVFMI